MRYLCARLNYLCAFFDMVADVFSRVVLASQVQVVILDQAAASLPGDDTATKADAHRLIQELKVR